MSGCLSLSHEFTIFFLSLTVCHVIIVVGYGKKVGGPIIFQH